MLQKVHEKYRRRGAVPDGRRTTSIRARMSPKVKGFVQAQELVPGLLADHDRQVAACSRAACSTHGGWPLIVAADARQRTLNAALHRSSASSVVPGRARREPRLLPAGAHRAGRPAQRGAAARCHAGSWPSRCARPTASTSRCRCSTASGSGTSLQGDLGTSIATGRPVSSEVMRAVGNTLMLAVVGHADRLHRSASLFGLLAGYFRDALDRRSSPRSPSLGVIVPHYWLGMVLVIIFSVQLGWLPADRRRARRLGQLAFGLGVPALPDPAGRHDVGDPDGHHRAHGARAGRRDPAARNSCRRCAAKGLTRAARVPARRRRTPRRPPRGDGPAVRLSARRLDPDRDGVRLARHRLPAQRRDLPARPAAAAGHDPRAGACSSCCSTSWSTSSRRRSTRASSRSMSMTRGRRPHRRVAVSRRAQAPSARAATGAACPRGCRAIRSRWSALASSSLHRAVGDLRALDRAGRSLQGQHAAPAAADRHAGLSARHRRARPRHARRA